MYNQANDGSIRSSEGGGGGAGYRYCFDDGYITKM